VAQPTLPAGVDSPAQFSFALQLDTPLGLKDVQSPTHGIVVARAGEHAATVTLAATGEVADNRDFILDYRLAGDRIESGVMLMHGQGGEAENFFLAMIEPPQAVAGKHIIPREYIFVVDVSGSMNGFPLDTARLMLRELVGGLRPQDRFNVLLFAGSCRFLHEESVPATAENIARALALIDVDASGSTELIQALQRVYALPAREGVSRTIAVITDGYVTVEREALNLTRRHLGDANLFMFGIGSSVNRHLIEAMARAGMGEAFVITGPEQASDEAARFHQMIASPVLTNIQARFEGVETYDVVPQALPDVLAQRPVILFGKWRKAAATAANPVYQLTIEGRNAEGVYRASLPLLEAVDEGDGAEGGHRERFAALRHLWARQRIAELADEDDFATERSNLEAEIIRLGLQYNLLSRYTSFVAIDQQTRVTNTGETVTVDQPLALPQGVSNAAVGGSHVPSSPEPQALGALMVTLSMLALIARWRKRQRRRCWTS
jgi:Ca-activated chloride channel family protein